MSRPSLTIATDTPVPQLPEVQRLLTLLSSPEVPLVCAVFCRCHWSEKFGSDMDEQSARFSKATIRERLLLRLLSQEAASRRNGSSATTSLFAFIPVSVASSAGLIQNRHGLYQNPSIKREIEILA